MEQDFVHEKYLQGQGNRNCPRSCFPRSSRIAVVLDIDGVVKQGARAIPGAAQTLGRLAERAIPFIFMTNGGGIQWVW